MTNIPGTQATDGVPTYLGRGDPAGRFADYYPAWVDKLAGDVTLEGSMLDGALQGPDAIRAVIGGVRELYDRQDFNFAGPWGDNGFIEDYTAEIRGRPLGCLHLVTFNAALTQLGDRWSPLRFESRLKAKFEKRKEAQRPELQQSVRDVFFVVLAL